MPTLHRGYDTDRSTSQTPSILNSLLAHTDLNTILTRPGNEFCVDCGAKGPRWASVNLGLLICIDCSGFHRGMGTHISVVKSLTLDQWNSKWIHMISQVGNELGRAYYEYGVAKHHERPKTRHSKNAMELWIRNKYEKKLYIPPNSYPPHYYVLKKEDPRQSVPEYVGSLKKKPKQSTKSTNDNILKNERDMKLTEKLILLKKQSQADLLDDFLKSSTPSIEFCEKKTPVPFLNESLNLNFGSNDIITPAPNTIHETKVNSHFGHLGTNEWNELLNFESDQFQNARYTAAENSIQNLYTPSVVPYLGLGEPTFPTILPADLSFELPVGPGKKVDNLPVKSNLSSSSAIFEDMFERSVDEISKQQSNTSPQIVSFQTGFTTKPNQEDMKQTSRDVFAFDFSSLDQSFQAFCPSTSSNPILPNIE